MHITLYPIKVKRSNPSILNLLDYFDRTPFFQDFEKILGDDISFNPWKFVDGKYSAEFEFPRFRRENISITVERGIVHVKAEQGDLKQYQTLSLPEDLDVSTLTSTLDHGVLSLFGDQKADARPLQISIADATPAIEKV